MSAQTLPIKLWGASGPNPPKVGIILEELGLPYEIVSYPISDVRKPEYTRLNPNGRLPTIEDPNRGLTLWESGAIVEYLIERYDSKQLISFPPGSNESYLAKQWLFFQSTGQAPYFGQAAWFKKFHPEQVPSAKERYNNEVNRICNVLEGYLAKQEKGADGPWLVGGKCSYADLSFVQWQRVIGMVMGKDEYDLDNFPVLKEWVGRMTSRKAVMTVLEEKMK